VNGDNVGPNFIRDIVEEDVRANRDGGIVVTRFPPEPNGYLHIGHAKAVCLDFGMALDFGGRCHLRMDDTNPSKETEEFVEAIKTDIRWLGFDWGDHFYYSADYFRKMYDIAEELIRHGHAYVCGLSQEEWKTYRGVPTAPGTPSPHRDRPADESLDLFRRMRAGEFADGELCLRSRIDMASPNIHFRDPVLYRILHTPHYRAGDSWCIYPMYDFAHPIEDALEGITHSLCTLEFEVHRPLYDWVIDRMDELGMLKSVNGVKIRPRQREFARLNLSYTIMSKRKLQQLVAEKRVSGWDDPRMPTLAGLRRRGYTPEAIREFARRIGVTKFESLTDMALLEHCLREDLNRRAPRAMAVLRPLKLVIENYPDGDEETFDAVNNPEDPAAGTRKVPFSRELYIERDDFMENPPAKFHRLAPGREVRLRYACYVTCTGVEKDSAGNVTAVLCKFDPQSRGGGTPDGRRVKGTIHWVSARHAVPAEFRLYDRLFTKENPADESDGSPFVDHINPASLETVQGWVEPLMAFAAPGTPVQFERLGYFCPDLRDAEPGKAVFNRSVTLRDSWARAMKAGKED